MPTFFSKKKRVQNDKNLWSRGQSIVEVLIATAVVAIVLTAVASGLTYSVKNSSEAKFRAYATTYAQDAIEVIRRERAILGWETFQTEFSAGDYCFNTLPSNTAAFVALTTGECSSGTALFGTEFRRDVTVTPLSVTEVEVTVTVSWLDGVRSPSVNVVQRFQPY